MTSPPRARRGSAWLADLAYRSCARFENTVGILPRGLTCDAPHRVVHLNRNNQSACFLKCNGPKTLQSSSTFIINYIIPFELKRPQGRHIAQIEALGLFYQNQVAKSWWKLMLVQKIDLKFRHHPQNPKFFWKIFLNFLRINRFGPQGLALIILRNYHPILVYLEPN